MISTTTIRKLITVTPGVEIYTERRTLSTTVHPKETIVFVHGLGCSLNVFYPIFGSIIAARPESTLLAYDWPGNGTSTFPVSTRPNPTFNDFISDLDNLISLEAPEGPLTIIAHSAGTFVASRWLTSPHINSPHVPRVRSVIMIAGPLQMPVPEAVVQMQKGMADTVLQAGVHGVEEIITANVLGPTTMREKPMAVALLRSILFSSSKEGYAASIRAMAGASDEGAILWRNLAKDVRVLFIGGKEDAFISHDVLKAISGEVQGSELVMLDLGQ